jgi:hypothetical protein
VPSIDTPSAAAHRTNAGSARSDVFDDDVFDDVFDDDVFDDVIRRPESARVTAAPPGALDAMSVRRRRQRQIPTLEAKLRTRSQRSTYVPMNS